MLVIFGWTKERSAVGRALKCYCYRCHRQRDWEHWEETEWVTFFLIKTIPFMSKNFVVCTACRQAIEIGRKAVAHLRKPVLRGQLADVLEEEQLLHKTESQRRFLLATREQAPDS